MCHATATVSQPYEEECVHAFVLSHLSHVQLFATLWTVACQAPLSMGFPRQEYWSGLLFLSPGDLSDPGIKPMSPALAGRFFITELYGKPLKIYREMKIELVLNVY